ncbi:MAG: PAAR domain-containing protein, partial [Desulfovibrio sp.]|nr:PAAR domain-containing protein [Desulfovibrio sp.]
MPKAARKGDKAQHGDTQLTAVQGSPNVFINGQPAVRVGDVYQGEAHPASQGSATVNINGKPAVRIGDSVGG